MIEIWKRFETLQQKIEELEAENCTMEAAFFEIEKMLREVSSQADELKEAIAKMNSSESESK